MSWHGQKHQKTLGSWVVLRKNMNCCCCCCCCCCSFCLGTPVFFGHESAPRDPATKAYYERTSIILKSIEMQTFFQRKTTIKDIQQSAISARRKKTTTPLIHLKLLYAILDVFTSLCGCLLASQFNMPPTWIAWVIFFFPNFGSL